MFFSLLMKLLSRYVLDVVLVPKLVEVVERPGVIGPRLLLQLVVGTLPVEVDHVRVDVVDPLVLDLLVMVVVTSWMAFRSQLQVELWTNCLTMYHTSVLVQPWSMPTCPFVSAFGFPVWMTRLR